MLRIENLDVFHGDAQALDDVSLDIAEGAIVAIVGANGAGKTSLIRTIAGMHRPARGHIRFRDTEIGGWDSHRVCNLGIGQVAEGRQVFPTLSVAENLDVGAMLPRARGGRDKNLERVFALFPVLAERAGQAAGTLSGGEQQMVALARAILARPRLVMVDEMSQGLAPTVVKQLFEILRVFRDQGIAVLLVEQFVVVGDESEARKAAQLWRFLPKAFKGYHNIPDPREIQRRAEAEIPIEQLIKEWTVSTDPAVHVKALNDLFKSGVTIVNVHSGQADQHAAIDFYGSRVLPQLHSTSVS